jgi:hypothetical protein
MSARDNQVLTKHALRDKLNTESISSIRTNSKRFVGQICRSSSLRTMNDEPIPAVTYRNVSASIDSR